MFNKLKLISLFIFIGTSVYAQPKFSPDVLKSKREKLNLYLNKLISETLAHPLSDSSEEKWISSFNALQLLQKRNTYIDSCVEVTFNSLSKRSIFFQQKFLELIFANYPVAFMQEMKNYLQSVTDPLCFAITAEYITRYDCTSDAKRAIRAIHKSIRATHLKNPLLEEAVYHSTNPSDPIENINPFFDSSYLPHKTIVFSFQRKNRDYSGLVLIRDTAGKFVCDSLGKLFSVPQLARSISGLPYYLPGGNTPQGIYRITGLGISKSNFIGPTPNIQMIMPFEKSASIFMDDSTYENKEITIDMYRTLLPAAINHYLPLYQSYYAGLMGRNEIIAHGTTINSNWYKDKSYYPFTPSLGCLVTKEYWNENTGYVTYSDQQVLIDALTKAGGTNGYVIVIDIDDEKKPIILDDIVKKKLTNPQ